MNDHKPACCQTCGRRLRHARKRSYCDTCLELDREYRARERLRAEAEHRRAERKQLIKAEYGTSRLKVFEYLYQDLQAGGHYNLLGRRAMKRRCADCAQDDRHIRGDWSPAFEDEAGRLTLLCWPCYRRRMEEAS